MDSDRVILGTLSQGSLEVDFDTGYIYSRRVRGKEGQRIRLQGTPCNGYIVHKISFKGMKRQVRAHRVVWMAAHGFIPEGLVVDHKNRKRTDNRLENLRLVDSTGNAENRPDTFGEHNPAVKLTQLQVQEIRERYQQGDSVRQIAEDFEISKSQVHSIVTGKSWPEVEEPMLSGWLDGYRWPAGPGQAQYEWEPPRVTREKVPNHVAQLRAYGNSISPPVAAAVGLWLRQIAAWLESEHVS